MTGSGNGTYPLMNWGKECMRWKKGLERKGHGFVPVFAPGVDVSIPMFLLVVFSGIWTGTLPIDGLMTIMDDLGRNTHLHGRCPNAHSWSIYLVPSYLVFILMFLCHCNIRLGHMSICWFIGVCSVDVGELGHRMLCEGSWTTQLGVQMILINNSLIHCHNNIENHPSDVSCPCNGLQL